MTGASGNMGQAVVKEIMKLSFVRLKLLFLPEKRERKLLKKTIPRRGSFVRCDKAALYAVASMLVTLLFPYFSQKYGRGKILYFTTFLVMLGFIAMMFIGIFVPDFGAFTFNLFGNTLHLNGKFILLVIANFGIGAPDALLLSYPRCCPSPTYFNGNKDYPRTYILQGDKDTVTPMPGVYVNAGLDPRLPENELAIMEQIRYMTTDLQGLVPAFQVMNEQTEMIFRAPRAHHRRDPSAHFLHGIIQSLSEIYAILNAGLLK